MKDYLQYKPAKFKWIDKIPFDWHEGKISYFFEIGRGRVISELDLIADGIYPVYSSQTKNNGRMGFINTFDFDGEMLTWTTDGANAGTVFYRAGKFNCTNVCGTLTPKRNLDLKFYLYYLTFATRFYKRPDTNGAKIMNNEMAGIYCLIPSISEQRQISLYLDYKTGIIDKLIQKQEQLIQVLKEKKVSIISSAVIKGLDTTVNLQKTLMDWADTTPVHWKTRRLKYLFKINKDISGKLGLKVLSVTQRGIKIRDLDNLKGQLSMDYSKYQLVKEGDFVMNHMDLLTGFVDISKWNGVTSPDYRVFTAKHENVYPKYYLYIFQFCYHNKIFFALGQGVSQLGRWRMPAKSFNDFIVPLPPKKEQMQIVSYLDKAVSMIDSVISKETMLIDKFKQYRDSLISDAVTGKIDLRNWQLNKQEIV